MANLFAKHRSKMRDQKNSKSKQASLTKKADLKRESVEQSAIVDRTVSDLHPHNSKGIVLEITGLSHDGRGVARHKGKAQFVENGLPGERVRAEVLSHKSKYDEMRATEVLHASAERVTPECKYVEACGGCSLQHLSIDSQIKHKQSVLLEQLSRHGLHPEELISPIHSSAYYYRSRTRVACDMRRGKEAVGFRARSEHRVLDIESCPVLSTSISDIANFKSLIAQLNYASDLGHLELLEQDGRPIVLLRLVKNISSQELLNLKTQANEIDCDVFIQTKNDKHAKRVWPEGEDSLLSYDLELAWGETCRTITLHNRPSDFTQVNQQVNNLMVNKVLELLEINSSDRILDLFCGLGNFTLPMALFSKQVVGVEGSQGMVERASENASRNNIQNAIFQKADLFADFGHAPWAQPVYDSVVLDPPRAGAKELSKKIGDFKAQRIVYISCNPATLARDSLEICKQGYRMRKAGILDMFPQTSHLESLAVFER